MDLWRYCTAEKWQEFLVSLDLLGGVPADRAAYLRCLYALSNHPEAHYRTLSVPSGEEDAGRFASRMPFSKKYRKISCAIFWPGRRFQSTPAPTEKARESGRMRQYIWASP